MQSWKKDIFICNCITENIHHTSLLDFAEQFQLSKLKQVEIKKSEVFEYVAL